MLFLLFFQLSGLLLLSNNHMGHKISRVYKREGYYRSIDKLYFINYTFCVSMKSITRIKSWRRCYYGNEKRTTYIWNG